MILTMYVLKNRLSGIYEKPLCDLAEPKEYCEMLMQSLAVAPVNMLLLHKEYDLYSIGSFNSQSGEVTSSSPEFVMSLEGICLKYLAFKEKKDVRREEEHAEASV